MTKISVPFTQGNSSWIDKEFIDVRLNEHGQMGSFARKFIPANTLLDISHGANLYAIPVTAAGRLDLDEFGLEFSDVFQLCRFGEFVICMGDRNKEDLTGIDFVNHSCRPNCAIKAAMQLWSLVDIEQDSELFCDYRETDFVAEGIECWCNTDEKCVI